MIRIFIITLIQGLLPIIPCLFSYHQGIDKVITPWPLLVLFIFFFNVFIILKFWKYLGYTKARDKEKPSFYSWRLLYRF